MVNLPALSASGMAMQLQASATGPACGPPDLMTLPGNGTRHLKKKKLSHVVPSVAPNNHPVIYHLSAPHEFPGFFCFKLGRGTWWRKCHNSHKLLTRYPWTATAEEGFWIKAKITIPYHPCTIYLPAFGWILWYINVAKYAKAMDAMAWELFKLQTWHSFI